MGQRRPPHRAERSVPLGTTATTTASPADPRPLTRVRSSGYSPGVLVQMTIAPQVCELNRGANCGGVDAGPA
jgi:hypothetical protein